MIRVLSGGEAAIGDDHLAGDKARLFRQQEDNKIRDLVRRAEPAHRDR